MARNNSTYHLVSLYQPSWVIHRSQSTSISHFFYPGDTDSLGDTIVEAYGDSQVRLTSLGRITGRTRAKGPRPPGENWQRGTRRGPRPRRSRRCATGSERADRNFLGATVPSHHQGHLGSYYVHRHLSLECVSRCISCGANNYCQRHPSKMRMWSTR